MDQIVEGITISIEEWANERLKEKKPIINFITRYYIKKVSNQNDFKHLFEDVENEKLKTNTIDILKPRTVDDFIWEIKHDAKIEVPTLIVSVEEVVRSKDDVLNEYYKEFYSDTESVEKKEIVFIMRFETYNTSNRRLYKVENDDFIFVKELPSDGKKFLPIYN